MVLIMFLPNRTWSPCRLRLNYEPHYCFYSIVGYLPLRSCFLLLNCCYASHITTCLLFSCCISISLKETCHHASLSYILMVGSLSMSLLCSVGVDFLILLTLILSFIFHSSHFIMKKMKK